jgi:20S proteasome subunit beta 2
MEAFGFEDEERRRDEQGGFSFELCARDAALQKEAGVPAPIAMKTGTTIVGVVAKDAVVLAADTRATEGPLVADKNCKKLHFISPNMYCAGAGTSADLEFTTDLISSKIALHRLNTGREARVTTALRMLRQHLFPYGGYISAYLLLGGVDVTGPSLHMIHAHGSSAQLPYATMGSGSLAAMSILEARYKDSMGAEEAAELAKEAVQAGILNDMGSGGWVDVVVIKPGAAQAEFRRNVLKPLGTRREFRIPGGIVFPPGTTPVLAKDFRHIAGSVQIIQAAPVQPMDT